MVIGTERGIIILDQKIEVCGEKRRVKAYKLTIETRRKPVDQPYIFQRKSDLHLILLELFSFILFSYSDKRFVQMIQKNICTNIVEIAKK